MRYVLDRLREPSTFAGMAAVFASLGLFGLSEGEWNQVFAAVTGLAGAVAILVGENDDQDKGATGKSL